MWLRLALHWDVAYVAEPLMRLRRHPRQESQQFMGNVRKVEEVWRCLEILFREQRDYVPYSGALYKRAIVHLGNWVGMFLKAVLRRGSWRDVGTFAGLWVRFRWEQARGLTAPI